MVAYPRFIASYTVPVQPVLSVAEGPALSVAEGSVPDFAVSLPSAYRLPRAALRLANTYGFDPVV
ncbi:MAG: hypothetical protein NTX61_02830 [Bacteroidetes bacterium]|nr:hypothetical protein [Bacteroidota bacterium]